MSIWSLQTVARSYGLETDAINLTWEDLVQIYASNPDARIVAHINSNHFVTITGINLNIKTITYQDHGIGKDGENESLTVLNDAFLSMWQGNTYLEHEIAEDVENYQEKLLSVQEAQSIRGAFWGSMLNLIGTILMYTPLLPIAPLFHLAGFIVSLAEGDWISAITSVVTLGFGDLSIFGQVFGGLGQAVASVFNGIGSLISGVFSAVAGIVKPIVDGIGTFIDAIPWVVSGFGADVAKAAVETGLRFGISRGLESLGLPPELASFAGAFISGGVMSARNPGALLSDTQVLKNVQANLLQTDLITGVGKLGMELEWDSGFTNILGLTLAAMTGNIIQNPTSSLEQSLSRVAPKLASSLAAYGVTELGDELGLDPRLSGLISSPISGAIGAGFGGGNDMGKNIIAAVNQGLLTGATDLAIGYAVDELEIDPLVGALSVNAITGGILGAFNADGNILKGAFDSFGRSALNLLTFGGADLDPNDPGYGWKQAEYILRIQKFSDALSADTGESGLEKLGNVLYANATQVFTRGAIENIWTGGGITDFLTNKATSIKVDGKNVTKVDFGTKNNEEYLYIDPSTFAMTGRDYIRYVDQKVQTNSGVQTVKVRQAVSERNAVYGFDEGGNFGIVDGETRQELLNGVTRVEMYEGGVATKVYFENSDGVLATVNATNPLLGVLMDDTGEIVKDSIEIVDEVAGISTVFNDSGEMSVVFLEPLESEEITSETEMGDPLSDFNLEDYGVEYTISEALKGVDDTIYFEHVQLYGEDVAPFTVKMEFQDNEDGTKDIKILTDFAGDVKSLVHDNSFRNRIFAESIAPFAGVDPIVLTSVLNSSTGTLIDGTANFLMENFDGLSQSGAVSAATQVLEEMTSVTSKTVVRSLHVASANVTATLNIDGAISSVTQGGYTIAPVTYTEMVKSKPLGGWLSKAGKALPWVVASLESTFEIAKISQADHLTVEQKIEAYKTTAIASYGAAFTGAAAVGLLGATVAGKAVLAAGTVSIGTLSIPIAGVLIAGAIGIGAYVAVKTWKEDRLRKLGIQY